MRQTRIQTLIPTWDVQDVVSALRAAESIARRFGEPAYVLQDLSVKRLSDAPTHWLEKVEPPIK